LSNAALCRDAATFDISLRVTKIAIMKAAYINQTGGPEQIIYGELPDPQAGPHQCLIQVAAVDVNPVDLYLRSGAVPAKLTFPYILGRDLAGKVIDVGANVERFKVGDRVWAIGQGWDGRPGTFSELAAVDEAWLNPIPGNVTDEDIAAISLVGVTAPSSSHRIMAALPKRFCGVNVCSRAGIIGRHISYRVSNTNDSPVS